MRRRLFLTACAATLVARPRRRAQADTSLEAASSPAGTPLGSALSRARITRRPVLVIVAPKDENKSWELGNRLGDLIEHGSPEALYPLSLVDPIAAPISHLPSAVKGHPLFVVIDPDGTIANSEPDPGSDSRAALATALACAVLTDAARLAKLAGSPAPTTADRQSRGAAAQQHWRKHPIPGTRWGYTEGCGATRPASASDEDEVSIIGCGMGSVERHTARRFLRLYVAAKKQRHPQPI